ncbi:MAG: hypothetical protein ACTH58_04925 [Marinomonas foliarum]|uniref:hypothetical protein n=1 Tax=Marinomonas foliarum TaxID=491950 RepID=UPI003F9B7DF0
MTAKKPNTTAKATTQKSAAELKADEVAALMGEDAEVQTSTAPTAPPALKGATKTEPEVEEKAPEDQPETVDQTDTEGADESDDQGDDLDTDDEESDDQDDEQEDQPATAKTVRMVILSKTIHTKDKAGNDVKFIASKDPQDLGEFAAMAIAAKCAKPHKAG